MHYPPSNSSELILSLQLLFSHSLFILFVKVKGKQIIIPFLALSGEQIVPLTWSVQNIGRITNFISNKFILVCLEISLLVVLLAVLKHAFDLSFNWSLCDISSKVDACYVVRALSKVFCLFVDLVARSFMTMICTPSLWPGIFITWLVFEFVYWAYSSTLIWFLASKFLCWLLLTLLERLDLMTRPRCFSS